MKKNKAQSNITTLEEHLEEQYGPIGSAKSDEFQRGYEAFKMGVMLKEARIKQGLTQEQVAAKIGVNKSAISKVENDIKDVRLSTLHRIIEALGGRINFYFPAA